jgi:cellulose synthase/poly-beta-1,6-N-acetylglucosamine synthase-like glycosyltransferase
MNLLTNNFLAASPRTHRIRTPAASWLIHGAVVLVFVLLLAHAGSSHGLIAWSAGLAYVAYDTALLAFTTVQTFSLARRAPAPPVATARPPQRLSVGAIVAAHNEAAALPATLNALLRQSDRPDTVVVADDGSTDATPEALAAFGLCPPAPGQMVESSSTPGLFWLRLPRGGKARALNAALTQISSDIILTVDADTILEPGATTALCGAFAVDPALVAATGVLTPTCAPGGLGRLFAWFQTYEYIRNFLSRFAWMRADGLLLISGACAGFRRDAVLAVGGFDPNSLVEDYELIHRLRRHGAQQGLKWHTAVLGSVQAHTDAPATFASFLRQRRRWFGGFLQVQLWYRDMVGNPAYGRLGTWMLPVKAADALQPIFGLTAFGLLVWHLAHGHWQVLAPISLVIAAKLTVDLAFHLWSLHLYRSWTGSKANTSFGYALLAALLEPFSFQLLRHAGAALGWVTFLGGLRTWGMVPAGKLDASW